MRAAVRNRKDQQSSQVNPHEELNGYLNAPLEEHVEDVVSWWGAHQFQYPTLSRIARDYLAVQGSSVPSERAFSSGALTSTRRRNRLTPELFEALQMLKSAYRNGLVGAARDAEAHVTHEIEAVEMVGDTQDNVVD
jgi:hypothetical protein